MPALYQLVQYPIRYMSPARMLAPSDVASLSASLNPSDLTKIYLSWPPVDDIDLAGYRIREGTTIITTIIENLAQITTYTYTAAEDRLHSFTVKAVDNSGNESTTPAVADIVPIVHPATPTGFTALQNGEYAYLYWNRNSATDIAGYEIRQGTLFNNGLLVQTGITGTDLSVPVSAETKYRYHIKAINNAGNYSEDAGNRRGGDLRFAAQKRHSKFRRNGTAKRDSHQHGVWLIALLTALLLTDDAAITPRPSATRSAVRWF